jgi:hypothetical protein
LKHPADHFVRKAARPQKARLARPLARIERGRLESLQPKRPRGREFVAHQVSEGGVDPIFAHTPVQQLEAQARRAEASLAGADETLNEALFGQQAALLHGVQDLVDLALAGLCDGRAQQPASKLGAAEVAACQQRDGQTKQF